MEASKDFPKSFGLLIYPGFEVLDAAGPIEVLNCLNRHKGFHDMTLSVISRTVDPVSPDPIASDVGIQAFQSAQLYVPTHALDNAPDFDTLIVPGGYGSFNPLKLPEYIKFIADRYHGKNGHKPLKYILSVCNGAGLLAASGILDGKTATTNKDFFDEIAAYGPKTQWQAKARWVSDGNIWTTSGVSAGTDGLIAWMGTMIPKPLVDEVVNGLEWFRARESDNDPFAEIFKRKDIAPVSN